MRAVRVVSQDADDPLSGLSVEDRPHPEPRTGWVPVRIVAAALNMHDLWTLRGVGHPAERVPMTLGCDGAGFAPDGSEVIVYPMLGDGATGDITLDPRRSMLSETVDGTFADVVMVPEQHLVPKPPGMSFAEAATLPVAFGTAYRMLFTRGKTAPGQVVLVQGAAGGVSSAAILLAKAVGATVYATSRSVAGRAFATSLGATALVPGGRLPEQADVVIETVGAATWGHSLRAVRNGGVIVVAGATTGSMPPADLSRVFFRQLRIVGSVGSTLDELHRTVRLIDSSAIRPPIAGSFPVERAREAFAALLAGNVPGKLILSFANDAAHPRLPSDNRIA
ncbi:zinc-binding dehydrogenase [Leucobacter komagatae]|uniref:Molecular chaperone GroES n=1 Tax=Leucobacter komagatae TaxID=55969 RepID=A0A0D0HWL2_9MICO|nr:quinone oxidoreductase [Leucobacter komagatae]KIP51986.1 molecular chaperone GroES [Leucobacter komagatae]